MAVSYKGLAPLTLVPTTNNTVVYVYADAPVPDNAEPKRRKELVDEGFLGRVGDESDPVGGGQAGGPAATK